MEKLKKINAFLHKKKPSPDYTRNQLIMKAITLFLAAEGMDASGLKLYSLETSYALRQISYEAAFGLPTIWYYFVHGMCMGLALWKLFEFYWWGKDQVLYMKAANSLEV